MKTQYFTENEYHTPKDHKRAFADRLFLNSNLYFLYKLGRIVLRSKRKAMKGEYTQQAFAASCYEMLKVIESCGGRFHLTGLDNIDPEKGPYVFISNHMSTLETMVFPCIINPKVEASFVVKNSLVSYPYFGEILRATNPIVVSRENSREDLVKVLAQGTKMLSEGRSVIIFPQSTRQKKFNPDEFNTLGVKLASKANVKVIPIAIKTDFWGNGKIVKDLGPLYRKKEIFMDFGKAFQIKENGGVENNKIIIFIKERLNRWGN